MGEDSGKEATTPFLCLLTVRGVCATHTPVEALLERPIQLAFKKILSPQCTQRGKITGLDLEARSGESRLPLVPRLQGRPGERQSGVQVHPYPSCVVLVLVLVSSLCFQAQDLRPVVWFYPISVSWLKFDCEVGG